MTLGRIKELCRDKGIKICDLEIAVNLSNGTIYKWDGKNPGIENVKLVADYFGVTVDELLRETKGA